MEEILSIVLPRGFLNHWHHTQLRNLVLHKVCIDDYKLFLLFFQLASCRQHCCAHIGSKYSNLNTAAAASAQFPSVFNAVSGGAFDPAPLLSNRLQVIHCNRPLPTGLRQLRLGWLSFLQRK